MKGIYIITNLINGKRYIGLSNNIKRRFMEHKTPKNIINKDTVLAKAFRRYGIENFSFKIIEKVKDESILGEREMFWIKKLNPEYNMNLGGSGNLGHTLSDELKETLRRHGKKQWAEKTEYEKRLIIKNNLTGVSENYKMAEETKEKLRNANLGKKQSESTKRKRSLKNKIKLKGNTNGNKAVRSILNDKVIQEYVSAVEAGEDLNIHPSNITKVIKGKQKTAGGYKWEFIN